MGEADTKVRCEIPNWKIKFFTGSISTAKLDKLIFVSFPLLPVVNKAEEAKLRPITSLVVVKLAPICSISRRFPPEIMILFFLSTIHFPERPYLNF